MHKLFNTLSTKFKEAVVAFLPVQFVWALLFIVLRFVEVAMEWLAHGTPKQLGMVMLLGFVKDIAFVLTASFWIFLFFYVLCFVHQKIAQYTLRSVAVLLCVIQLILSNYFVTTLVPLGADFWSYSFADIQQTVGAAGIKIGVIVGLLIAVAFFVFAIIRFPKKINFSYTTSRNIVLLLLFAQLFHVGEKAAKLKISNEQATNLSVNKSYFFYKQTLKKIFPEEADIDIYADSYINDNGLSNGGSATNFTYIDENNFPFLHKEITADVLSPFFNKSNTPPNIVFILTEGLGRAFTNTGAYLGNFTPFIDSLSQKSLYWENFLSEGGRTFAVLPSILGSLPFAKSGFCELADKAPANLNLINMLAKNGYSSSFYYGGNSHFDFMDVFLKRSGIGSITDVNSFPSGYTKMPSSNGFSWGYGDKDLFKYALIKNISFNKPSLQIFLTVSSHNPFLINEQETYIKKFEDRMQQLSFDENRKKEYRNYQKQYASILYTDDAIKNFITAYSKRADFNNTVFIITGDHRMPEIPMATKLDRYHVPLIIYSPLLNRTAKFSSVSTHFDVAPTLLAWLKNQYGFSMPAYTSWIGTGIDTTRSFVNNHQYPFMQTKEGVNGFLMNNYFFEGEDFYELGSNMSLSPLQDEALKSKVKAAFEQFKQRNSKIINGAKLLPDSILQQY